MTHRGLFITLEGIDGAGKSTQARLLVRYLRRRGLPVRATREPGGTRVGERIRGILLASSSEALAPLAELSLMYSARAQHLAEVVRPSLARGEWVVSDRYNDASLAYQGYGRRLGVDVVKALDRVICGKTQPDLTIVLDLSPRRARVRARGRERGRNSPSVDSFEAQGLKFHERVRTAYLGIARQDPRRVKVVRADRPPGQVQADIRKIVEALLMRRRKPEVRSQKSE